MKFIVSIILFGSLSIMVSSCGSDNECSADDWVGTWIGSAECDDGTTEATTLIITKVDDNTISLSDGADTFEIDVDGCRFSIRESLDIGFGPINVDLTGEVDGSNMTYVVEATLLGQSVKCTANLNG